MWKLTSLGIVVALAAVLWFRINGTPQDISSTPPAPSQGNTDISVAQRPQADNQPDTPRSGRPAEGNERSSQGAPEGEQGRQNAQGGRPDQASEGGRPNQAGGGGRPNQAGEGGGRPAQAGNSGRPAQGSGRRGGGRPPPLVVTRPVTMALINDRLKAVGSGTALASVSVVPLSSGMLTEVLVESGQRVQSGYVLAKIDNESELIARDRAARTVADAANDANRIAKLVRSNTATSVELDRARATLADAELALREAELKLSRRTITAPISGIVGIVPVDKGNYVTTQTELSTIDDRSTIIVEFWVPESFANQVSIKQPVEAVALADPSKTYDGFISGIGSRIETDSRTLPVQATLNNDSDSLRPGMSFELQLRFAGQEYPAVNPLSIQWDSNGSYIWKIVENKASRVPVTVIQRNPESVLVDAELEPEDAIAIEGLLSLRPGATVRIQGARRP
ncbi:MAG: efflux RND transporter periplasmic adaptor subunit [Granulosicoccus sp.]